MKKNLLFIAVFFVFGIGFTQGVFAQSRLYEDMTAERGELVAAWAEFGYGGGSSQESFSAAAFLGWQLKAEREFLLGLKHLRIDSFGSSRFEYSAECVNILVGKSINKRWFSARMISGVGVIRYFEKCFLCTDEFKRINDFGVPVNGAVSFTPTPWLGLGGEVFTNLNFQRPFAGMELFVTIGFNRKP